jgi:hypothetical protein
LKRDLDQVAAGLLRPRCEERAHDTRGLSTELPALDPSAVFRKVASNRRLRTWSASQESAAPQLLSEDNSASRHTVKLIDGLGQVDPE